MSDIPAELLKMLGKYTEVMELDLSSRKNLAREDITVVKANIIETGYHLQIPIDIVKNVVNFKE